MLELESHGEKGEWGFKALKQMIKISFRLGEYETMMRHYERLLTYIKSAVTRNYSEKSINAILDYISTSNQMDLLEKFYETTLAALQVVNDFWKSLLKGIACRMRAMIAFGLRRTSSWASCISTEESMCA